MLEFQNVSYQYPSEDFDIIDRLYELGFWEMAWTLER